MSESEDMALRTARERLSGDDVWEEWAGGHLEVVDAVEVLWSGWECDSLAALARLPSGEHRVIFVDGTLWPGDRRTPVEVLEERAGAYEAAAARTRAFLATARALEIMDRAPDVPPDPGDVMPEGRWICPWCGTAFEDPQPVCPACGGDNG